MFIVELILRKQVEVDNGRKEVLVRIIRLQPLKQCFELAALHAAKKDVVEACCLSCDFLQAIDGFDVVFFGRSIAEDAEKKVRVFPVGLVV